MISVVEYRPVIVADKTRATTEQLSSKRELYDRFSCMELQNIAAYGYQDAHVWSVCGCVWLPANLLVASHAA